MTASIELLRPKSHPSDTRSPAVGGIDADGVLLAGTVGHEAHWTRGWPRPALPLPGGSMVEKLVERLGAELAGSLTLCVNGKTEWLGQQLPLTRAHGTKVEIYQDAMPRGSAGCLRDSGEHLTGRAILAMGASVWLEDEPESLLRRHRESGNALTFFCTADPTFRGEGAFSVMRPTSIVCCEPKVFDFVRPVGYQDIKEQLVPALQRAGLRVGAMALRDGTCEVTDWASYMHVLTSALVAGSTLADAHELVPTVFCGRDVEIGRNARLVGPILLGDRCRIADDALLIGPVVLGDGCFVEEAARLVRVVATQKASFAARTSTTDLFVAGQFTAQSPAGTLSRLNESELSVRDGIEDLEKVALASDATARRSTADEPAKWATTFVVMAAVFGWAFWGTLERLWGVWQGSADYGAGQLVPAAAAYMFYARRRFFSDWAPRCWKPGVALFVVGTVLNFVGEWYAFPFFAYAGVVVGVGGIVTSLLGPERSKVFLYPLFFLLLMCPLPQRVHETIMLPLQTLGASLSGGILEVIGIPVQRLGHVLEVGGHQIAVAEACSGLRMVLALTIVVAFVADLVRRPAWQRGMMLVSAIPVALTCNIARIVMAALLYFADLPWLAEGAFHDAAGLVMVPVALLLIVLELRLLDVITRQSTPAVVLGARERFFVPHTVSRPQ